MIIKVGFLFSSPPNLICSELAILSILYTKFSAVLSSEAFISLGLYPHYLANVLAKVVLPHPGGPANNNTKILY